MLAKILGINVTGFTMRETISFLLDKIKLKQQMFIITANAEIIMLAQDDLEFRKIITEQADLVLPDGAGVVLAARHLGYQIPERVAGCDLVQNLLSEAAKIGLRVYFFGAAPTIAEQASTFAKKNNSGLEIAGVRDGFFQESEIPQIIQEINNSNADMLFLALGVPKQEKFISKYRSQLNATLLMGVGGTFDVMAGNVKRAPVFMQKNNLEWFYRLLMQPSRFLRMLAIPKFVFKVFLSKLLDKQ